MCPQYCRRMAYYDDPQFNLLMGIQQKIRNFFQQDNVGIKILCSGIAKNNADNMPNYKNSSTPINIAAEPDRILYLTQNPLRPFTFRDFDGNWMTTLVLNSNCLAYSGNNW